MKGRLIPGWLLFIILSVHFTGCTGAEPADIGFFDQEGRTKPLFTSRKGKSGIVREGDTLVYRLEEKLSPGPNYALELSYTIRVEGKDASGVPQGDTTILFTLLPDTKTTDAGQVHWQLPLSGAFLGLSTPEGVRRLHYAIPLGNTEFSALSLDFQKAAEGTGQALSLQIEQIALVPLWFGFSLKEGELSCTPFVALRGGTYSIDAPEGYRGTGPWKLDLVADEPAAPVSLRTGTAADGGFSLVSEAIHPLVAGSLPEVPFPLALSVGTGWNAVVLGLYTIPPLPANPIPADPASILDYRQELWRREDYEVFQWDRFPNILIFDTRSYEVQDRLFKRLAFYVEKAGYRGRLATDAEIAHLHGWNAHDYQSKDLADFFTTAEQTEFPLNGEELELRDILLARGIIYAGSEGGKTVYTAGSGALISLSRESEDYLRRLFMVHEAFHGLFFIDSDFQVFAQERWTALDPVAKKFLVAYFRNRGYDTADSFLMKNELMAYCLQQGVSGAASYFGKILPERLSAFPQYTESIPERDERSGTWPGLASLFTDEARAFSDYVAKRWGLEAGRVWSITKRPL